MAILDGIVLCGLICGSYLFTQWYFRPTVLGVAVAIWVCYIATMYPGHPGNCIELIKDAWNNPKSSDDMGRWIRDTVNTWIGAMLLLLAPPNN